MSLLQMSFSGAAFIAAVVIIRGAAIHKVPKKTFLVLWELVMVRLLVPFSVPSVFSIYTLATCSRPSAASPGAGSAYRIPAMQGQSVVAEGMAQSVITGGMGNSAITSGMGQTPGNMASSVSIWGIVWCAGAISLALFFAMAYLRCLTEFRTALPIRNEEVEKWLKEHPLKRPLTVRQSDRISAPLTYGVFRPVILMPKKMDWKNEKQLQYILLHEYVHICRYDTVTKLIATLALCIHWFNPFVWMMYLLFNRDIELACDESVIRQSGEKAKSAYSLMLIHMEEAKSGLLSFCSNFNKNAIEERITAVMKMKKTSLFATCAAAVLIVSVTAAFATSAADGGQSGGQGSGRDDGKGKQENIHQDSETREYPNGTEEDYRSLLALKTADYQSRPVADFNRALLEWANEDYERMERINGDIGYNDFSVNLSSDELSFVALTTWLSGAENGKYVQSNYTGRKEEDPIYNQYLPMKTAEENGLGAWCDLFYQFSYHIADKKTLTVGERDNCISDMKNGIQAFWDETDIDEMSGMTKGDIVNKLKEIAAEYSNDRITITIPEDSVSFEKMDERGGEFD